MILSTYVFLMYEWHFLSKSFLRTHVTKVNFPIQRRHQMPWFNWISRISDKHGWPCSIPLLFNVVYECPVIKYWKYYFPACISLQGLVCSTFALNYLYYSSRKVCKSISSMWPLEPLVVVLCVGEEIAQILRISGLQRMPRMAHWSI